MMRTTALPHRRSARAAFVLAAAASMLMTAGCGDDGADRAEIARDLGLAYAAYTTYVSEPAAAGQLGPSTPKSAAVSEQAAQAARFATTTLDAAREQAASDPELASLTQKTAAARASLNAVTEVLSNGRPSRSIVAGGLASLDSLMAAARDRGLTIDPQTVQPADLNEAASN